MYGQWHGIVDGDNTGTVLLSIDKSGKNNIGSIAFQTTPGEHQFPVIAKLTIEHFDKNAFKGSLSSFLGFHNGEIIRPQDNEDVRLSDSGSFELKHTKDDRWDYAGSWTTNLKYSGTIRIKKVPPPETSPVKKVLQWDDFKKEVEDKSKYPYGTFFRGHSSSKYPLQTTFHRASCWDLYRYRFKVVGELFKLLGEHNNREYSTEGGSDFGQPLLLAQHHGFPTPLLDWTLSPYIAAYFCFRDFIDTKTKSVRVFAFHENRWSKEQERYTIGGLVSPGITVKPLEVHRGGNQRAIAQMATCLFSNVENVENILTFAEFDDTDGSPPEPYIEYFDINSNDRDSALEDLKIMNIHEMSLFPGLDGVCRHLRNKYFRRIT